MAIKELVSQEDLVFYEIMKNPVLFGEFVYNMDRLDREEKFAFTVYQKEFLLDVSNYQSLACGRAVGKCVHESAMIMNPDTGEYLSAKEWYESTRLHNILSINQDWKQEVNECFVEYNGTQDCYEIETDKGLKTVVTKEHPFLTNSGFVNADRLEVGNYLAVAKNTPYFGVESADDIEYITLAHFIAEGTYYCGSITTTEPEVFEDLKKIAEYFGCNLRVKDITYFISKKDPKIKNQYLSFLSTHGLRSCHSYDKFVPELVFKSKKGKVALFLNRLFGDDGWCTANEVGYCSTSERLARDVQHLLFRFGVFASLAYKKNPYLGAWCLSIKGVENVQLFRENIGIFTKRKSKKLEELLQWYLTEKPHNQAKVYPILSYRAYRKTRSRSTGHLKYFPTDETINKVVNVDAELSKFINADINWVRVKNIRLVEKQETYSITVPHNSTHLIDNIWSHNTVSLSTLMIWYLVFNVFPNDYILYTVPSKVHLEPVFTNLIRLFRSNSFLKQFIEPRGGINGSDYTVKLLNQATLLCRIAGQSGTGANVIGLHTPVILLDESGYYAHRVFQELQPSLNTFTPGFKLLTSGVPTGLREGNVLYHTDQENSSYSKHRVSALQNPRFSEEDRQRALEQYGGEDSEDYIHFVLGLHGKPVFSLFDRGAFEIINNPVYKLVINGWEISENIDDYITRANLIPQIPDKSYKCIIGIDLGYTEPTAIIILYQDGYGRIKFHARITLNKVSYTIQDRFIDLLDSKFKPYIIGIDEGGVGKPVVQRLKESLDYAHKDYHKRLIPINFSTAIVMGTNSDGEEIKTKTKPLAVSVLQEYANNHKVVFSSTDFEMVTELERMTYSKTVTGEIVYKTLTERGGKKGEDHFTAALLCAILAYYLVHETMDFTKKRQKLMKSSWFAG